MNRPKRPYAIYLRRTKKKRRVYYAKFRDEATGKYHCTRSTGCSHRDDAVLWCKRFLEEQADKRAHIRFNEFVNGFWDPGAPYALRRISRGYSLSVRYLQNAESYTRTHLIPAFGPTLLRDITTARIDDWVVGLTRAGSLASATINRVLQHLRAILEEAVAEGRLTANAAKPVKPVKLNAFERGVLSREEVGRLLTPSVWSDFRHYAINLLAYMTGMRLGEIRGLLIDDLASDRVIIQHNWQDGEGLKSPKLGSTRQVAISAQVTNVLERVVRESTPTTFVFFGDSKETPMPKSAIERFFNSALNSIGIDEQSRLERHLSFHSWRHTTNTVLRSKGIPDSKIRLVTGHKSERMSDHYTHFVADDFREIATALEFSRTS